MPVQPWKRHRAACETEGDGGWSPKYLEIEIVPSNIDLKKRQGHQHIRRPEPLIVIPEAESDLSLDNINAKIIKIKIIQAGEGRYTPDVEDKVHVVAIELLAATTKQISHYGD